MSDIDLGNIDLLDTHLDFLDIDITSKHFVCLQDVYFTIAEALAEAHGAILKIPHFTKRKSQMSGKEVDNSRKISC